MSRPPDGECAVARHRCPICGKISYTTAAWAYQRRRGSDRIYMCSWSCLRRYDEKHPRKSRHMYDKPEEA